MLLVLSAALGASHAVPATTPRQIGATAWIVATVDHSEWCPAGNVRLDLVTGDYDYTPGLGRLRVCNDANVQRPVQHGKLEQEKLFAIQAKYREALAEGLKRKICRDGGQPDEIVIANGGVPILVMATGGRTASAPDDLVCWSQAAEALETALDEAFGPGK